ncbi:restriction endonuclease subunit S [Rhodopseudomonas palustris]|uniref:Type I restriction enzyme StySPI specificity protein n=1 Tax=Rhodopseudomonas palustris (strain BisB18) TaxID=316056 RepID=Q210J8_RHOPB
MTGDLPSGWVAAPIDDLRALEPNAITDGPYGSSLKTSHYRSSGARVVRLGNIGFRRFLSADAVYISEDHFKALVKHHVRAGDVLIAALGDPVGRSCIAPSDISPALVKADCFRLRCSPHLSAPFIMLWLNSECAREAFSSAAHGLGRVRINLSDFRTTVVPVPPATEQGRIVAKIDNLSAKSKRSRDHLDHIPQLVEKYKQAILAAAFRGELTHEWRVNNLDQKWPWPECSLSDIANIGTGATPKRGEQRYYSNGNIPWITSGAVKHAVVQAADEYITEAAVRETNCKVFPAGTILMAMYGEGKTRGRVTVLGINAATNQAVAAIQVRADSPAVRDFVVWHLRSGYLELRERAAGGVQPNLNLGIVNAWRIPLPSRDEQMEVVRRVQKAFAWIDRLTIETTSARKLIDRLDQAILAKAFRGELVPQDPNDEPASILLERIKAKRAGSAGHTRRRSARATS